MKKKIKKLGNSFGISFSQEEREVYDLKLRDVIDIAIKKEDSDGVLFSRIVDWSDQGMTIGELKELNEKAKKKNAN